MARACQTRGRRNYRTASHKRNHLTRYLPYAARYFQIERDNLLLLHKMHEILHTPSAFELASHTGPRSMNIRNRRSELLRITHDNHVSSRPSATLQCVHFDCSRLIGQLQHVTSPSSPRRRQPPTLRPLPLTLPFPPSRFLRSSSWSASSACSPCSTATRCAWPRASRRRPCCACRTSPRVVAGRGSRTRSCPSSL